MDEDDFAKRMTEIGELNKAPEGAATPPKGGAGNAEACTQLTAILDELRPKLEGGTDVVAISQTAQVHIALGVNRIAAGDVAAGRAHLEASLQHLIGLRGTDPLNEDAPRPAGHVEDRSFDHLLVEVYNLLAVLQAGGGEPGPAQIRLQAAEKLFTVNEKEKERRQVFDEWHLQTLTQMAAICANMGDPGAAARYTVTHLKRRLAKPVAELDRPEWVVKCLELSRLYLDVGDFSLADYCVRAADHVLSAAGGEKPPDAEAAVHLGAGKYGHEVLRASRQRAADAEPAPLADVPAKAALFDLPIAAPVAPIPAVRTFEEARDVFRAALPRLERALAYHSVERSLDDHLNVVLEVSALWRTLAQFEPDPERQVSMHKRRAALLEPLLDAEHVKSDRSAVRRVTYELGAAWNDVGDIRQAQIKSGTKVPPKKVNEACTASVGAYERFLATFLNGPTCPGTVPAGDAPPQAIPAELPSDFHHMFLMANLHIARQYTHMQSSEYAEAARYLITAADRYRYIADCATKYGIDTSPDFKPLLEMAAEKGGRLPYQLKELRLKYRIPA